MGTLVWRSAERTFITVVVKAVIRLVPDGTATLLRPVPLRQHDELLDGILFPREDMPLLPRAEVSAWGNSGSAEWVNAALVVGFGGQRLLTCQAHVQGPAIHCFAAQRDNPVPRALNEPGADGVVVLDSHIDWRQLQAAPAQQQLDGLRGDEWLATRGLHPEYAELSTRLPAHYAMVQFYSTDDDIPVKPVPLHLDTIRLHVAELTGTLLWRTHWPLAGNSLPHDLQICAGLAPFGQILEFPAEPFTAAPLALDRVSEDDDPWAALRSTRALTDSDVTEMAAGLPRFLDNQGGESIDAFERFGSTRDMRADETVGQHQSHNIDVILRGAVPFALAEPGMMPDVSPPPSIPGAPWSTEVAPAVVPPGSAAVIGVEQVQQEDTYVPGDIELLPPRSHPPRSHHMAPAPPVPLSAPPSSRGATEPGQAAALPPPPSPVPMAAAAMPPVPMAARSDRAAPRADKEHAALVGGAVPDDDVAQRQADKAEQTRLAAQAHAELARQQIEAARKAEQERLAQQERDAVAAQQEAQARQEAEQQAAARNEAEVRRFAEEQERARTREAQRQQEERQNKLQRARSLRANMYSGTKRRR